MTVVHTNFVRKKGNLKISYGDFSDRTFHNDNDVHYFDLNIDGRACEQFYLERG